MDFGSHCPSEGNKQQKEFVPFSGCISQSMLPTSDWSCLITTHIVTLAVLHCHGNGKKMILYMTSHRSHRAELKGRTTTHNKSKLKMFPLISLWVKKTAAMHNFSKFDENLVGHYWTSALPSVNKKGEGKMRPPGDRTRVFSSPVPIPWEIVWLDRHQIRADTLAIPIPWLFPFLGWFHSYLEVFLMLKSRKILEH